MQLTKPLLANFILLALFLCSCKTHGKFITTLTTSQTNVAQYQEFSTLISHGLFIVDSVVELSPRDTTTRVRFLRATSVARTETRVTDSLTVRDTVSTASFEIPKIPIAAESKKKGLASLCATAGWLAWLFSAVFFVVLVVCVKKSLFLQRQ